MSKRIKSRRTLKTRRITCRRRRRRRRGRGGGRGGRGGGIKSWKRMRTRKEGVD